MQKLKWLFFILLALFVLFAASQLQTFAAESPTANLIENDKPVQLTLAPPLPSPVLTPVAPLPSPVLVTPIVPLPSPGLTPIAPLPSPGLTPVAPLPSPISVGGIQLGSKFVPVWQQLGGSSSPLGNPAQPEVSGKNFAKQYFQSGIMYWLNTTQAPGSIWVMDTQNADFSRGTSWNIYGDAWSGGPTYPCPEAANNGNLGPVRGFGTLWCNRPQIRNLLGDPTEPEQGSGGSAPYGRMQRFQSGWMLYNPINDEVYVLFDQGSWLRQKLPVTPGSPPPPAATPLPGPTATPTPPAAPGAWQPQPPPAGQASLVWINRHQPDPMIIAINREQYEVPPMSGGTPGRLQINLSPDTYNYTASIPGKASTGTVQLSKGQVIGLNLSVGKKRPQADDQTVLINPVDLTAQTRQPVPPTPTPSQAGQRANLTFNNYIGQPLTLTINNQQYHVAANGQHTLNLLPGTYNYTVSLPGNSRDGTVTLSPGGQTELAVVIDTQQNVLQVYSN